VALGRYAASLLGTENGGAAAETARRAERHQGDPAHQGGARDTVSQKLPFFSSIGRPPLELGTGDLFFYSLHSLRWSGGLSKAPAKWQLYAPRMPGGETGESCADK
jgi:hypothetical protein